MIHMESLTYIFIIVFPSLHDNNQQENTLASTIIKIYHNPEIQSRQFQQCLRKQDNHSSLSSCLKTFFVNIHFYQGNPFLDSLSLLLEHTNPYLYGYRPPLDVNLTHWPSRNSPTLPLPHSGSTFHYPFYLILIS